MKPQPNQGLGLLAGLGLDTDPLQQLSGLVALINQMQQPDQFDQEMQLRQNAQEQNQQQFEAQQQLGYAGLHRQEANDTQAAAQWAQEYGLRGLLAQQEREMQMKQLQQQRELSNNAVAANILGLPAEYMRVGYQGNPLALIPADSPYRGFFTAPQNQGPAMPQGMNADQQETWRVRQSMFPTQQ